MTENTQKERKNVSVISPNQPRLLRLLFLLIVAAIGLLVTWAANRLGWQFSVGSALVFLYLCGIAYRPDFFLRIQILMAVPVAIFTNLAIAGFLTGSKVAWIHLGLTLLFLIAGLVWTFRGFSQLAGRRTTRYAVLSVTTSFVFIAILVIVVSFSLLHTREFDMTEGRIYSLEEREIQVLKGLKRPIRIVGFFNELAHMADRNQIGERLERMKRVNPEMISYEFIDPFSDPILGRQYSQDLAAAGYSMTRPAMLVEFIVPREQAESALDHTPPKRELVEGKTERIDRARSRTIYDSLSITNAVIRLTREGQTRVYFVTGHGEAGIFDTSGSGISLLRSELERLQYIVANHSFTRDARVPDDCDVLAIIRPQMDYRDEELQAIDRFVMRGGRLLVMIEPETAPKLARQMQAYGMEVPNEVVLELQTRPQLVPDQQGQMSVRFTTSVSMEPLVNLDNMDRMHPITNPLVYDISFPLARPVVPVANPLDGVTVSSLARSAPGIADPNQGIPYSWGETDVAPFVALYMRRGAGQNVTVEFKHGEDRPGPVSLACAVEIDLNQYVGAAPINERRTTQRWASDGSLQEESITQARVVCIGSGQIAWDSLAQRESRPFFLNTFNWLSEQEDLITGSPDADIRSTAITSLRAGVWTTLLPLICVQFMPMTFILIGILNAFWRRRFA